MKKLNILLVLSSLTFCDSWDPFRPLEDLQKSIHQMMKGFEESMKTLSQSTRTESSNHFVKSIDVDDSDPAALIVTLSFNTEPKGEIEANKKSIHAEFKHEGSKATLEIFKDKSDWYINSPWIMSLNTRSEEKIERKIEKKKSVDSSDKEFKDEAPEIQYSTRVSSSAMSRVLPGNLGDLKKIETKQDGNKISLIIPRKESAARKISLNKLEDSKKIEISKKSDEETKELA